MPAGSWVITLLPVGMLMFLGLLWWLDTLIKRSQRPRRLKDDRRRGFEVKIGGAGQQATPPTTRLKPPGPSSGTGDTRKGDHG